MTPKTKNGPERLHPLEALALINPYEERELTMSLPTPRYPRPPLAAWDATSLIMQATDEDRPVSQLLAEILADDAAAKRAARWELVTNGLLVLAGLAVAYFACVGIVATAISQGWSA